MDDYITQRRAKVTKSGETKKYLHSSIFAPFQKSYEQKEAAVDALKAALNGGDANLITHLSTLQNGELGKRLQNYVDAPHASFLVDEKVCTVRKLIEVLQKNIGEKFSNDRDNIVYNQKRA